MYPLITTSRANGPQARSQPTPFGTRRSPQSTVHAKPSPISTRQLRHLSAAAGLIASPAPLPSSRFSLTNQRTLPTRHPASLGVPNDPSPIFGHPIRHPSTATIRTTRSRPSSISIDRKSHNTREVSHRLRISASNPSHPNPSAPNDPNPILKHSAPPKTTSPLPPRPKLLPLISLSTKLRVVSQTPRLRVEDPLSPSSRPLASTTLRVEPKLSPSSAPATHPPPSSQTLLKCTKRVTPSFGQSRRITVRGAHVDL
jgi:hypothetical protein